MVKEITQYKSKDGKIWNSYEEAKEHETVIGTIAFANSEEMWNYVQGTKEWKEWMNYYNSNEVDIHEAEEKVREVSIKLKENHPRVVIEDKERDFSRVMNWAYFNWTKFEEVAIIDYFNKHANVKLSRDEIQALYLLAKREAYSHSLNDIIDVFEGFIEAALIIKG